MKVQALKTEPAEVPVSGQAKDHAKHHGSPWPASR